MSVLDPEPLVSVVIPVYNGEQWVGTAIESALAQTYRNLEIIAIDDGSRDRSLEVLQRYALSDPRVRVLQQTNQGVARARNNGIQQARGDLIAPLDADDVWLPQKIERQVEALMSAGPNTGFVYCWWAWIDHDGALLDRSPRWHIKGNVFEFLLQINFTGNASVPLFRKACILEAGGYNDKLAAAKAGGCEDWELVLRIAARHDVAVVPAILLGYRRTPGSMSAACDTMWRSQVLVVDAASRLRPDISPTILRRARQQFAMYLAGLSYWSGNTLAAVRWALRAGLKLPAQIAPHALRMMLSKNSAPRTPHRMVPGSSIDESWLAEPLIPYDKIYSVDTIGPRKRAETH